MISGGFSVSFSTPASSTLQQLSDQTSSQYIVSDSDRESVEWLLFCITMRFDIMKTTEELQAVPSRTPSHEVEGSIKEPSNMWVGFEGTGFHLRRRDPEIWLVAKEPRFFLKKGRSSSGSHRIFCKNSLVLVHRHVVRRRKEQESRQHPLKMKTEEG